MLEKRHKDWGDKVRVLGLNIDQDKAQVATHVQKMGWKHVEHFMSSANCAEAFGMRGVPHCLLVDRNGHIVWVGHPSQRDLEADIDALLADKKLEGKGVTRNLEDHRKEISLTEYYDLTKLFVDGCVKVCGECQEYGKLLDSAFFVLIADL